MPKGDPLQVVACRLSPADRDRLLSYAPRAGDAVRVLLDLAETQEHQPRQNGKAARQAPAKAAMVHQAQPQTQFTVMVGGIPVYKTTSKALATTRAAATPGATIKETT